MEGSVTSPLGGRRLSLSSTSWSRDLARWSVWKRRNRAPVLQDRDDRHMSGGGHGWSRLRDAPVRRPAHDHGGIPAGPFAMRREHRNGRLVAGQAVEYRFVADTAMPDK